MSTPILATKLYIPRPRPNVVSRLRLLKRLNEGMHSKLTLISAPAGFGKTTLVSEWVEGIDRPTAWLSIDEGENDPTRFLTYLVAALQTLAPAIGEGVSSALQSAQPPSIEALLVALLNDLSAIADPFVLVLDDYHLLDSQPVDQALTYLVEHLPPHLLPVIATREDPRLPLAALSMQGQQDTADFIRTFTGSHHFVMDYLMEEVLGQTVRARPDVPATHIHSRQNLGAPV